MNDKTETLVTSVFDLSPGEFSGVNSRADIAAWDSLRHMELVLAIENELGRQLSMDEILALDSVAAIDALLSGLQNA